MTKGSFVEKINSYIDQYTLSCLPLIWMRILICWIQYNELRYRGFNDNVGEVKIREKLTAKIKTARLSMIKIFGSRLYSISGQSKVLCAVSSLDYRLRKEDVGKTQSVLYRWFF